MGNFHPRGGGADGYGPVSINRDYIIRDPNMGSFS